VRVARIVHDAVESAEARDRVLHHRVDLLAPGDVGREGPGSRADLSRHLLSGAPVHVGDQHLRALRGEAPAHRRAEAGAAAGYDDRFVLETHRSPSS